MWQLQPPDWMPVAVSLAILAGVLLLGRRFLHFLFAMVYRLTRRTRTSLDDMLLEAIAPSGYLLLVALAFTNATAVLLAYRKLPGPIVGLLKGAEYTLYFVAAFVLVWRLIDKGSRWYGQEIAQKTQTRLDDQLMPFFRRVLLILISLIALVIYLDHFGINPAAVLTTLGIGSLAVALAAQTTFSDAINGFLIMVDRPFRIGDRIEIRELNTWGDVVDIGLRSTRILTIDNRMVIVPNSIIGQSMIVNHSYPDLDYRMHAFVGIAYGSDVDKAKAVMEAAIRRTPGVLPHRPVHVLFVEMGDSALVFRLHWWVRVETELDFYQMYDRVLTSVYKALQEAGITIPFPQRDVHHKVDPEDREVLARLLAGRFGPEDTSAGRG